LNSFQGQFSFFLNESKPIDLMDAKKKSKSLDDNWVWSGKLDILNPPRDPRANPKPKFVHTIFGMKLSIQIVCENNFEFEGGNFPYH
jgi:hypothetical protein